VVAVVDDWGALVNVVEVGNAIDLGLMPQLLIQVSEVVLPLGHSTTRVSLILKLFWPVNSTLVEPHPSVGSKVVIVEDDRTITS
jgi:hypothetical protein